MKPTHCCAWFASMGNRLRRSSVWNWLRERSPRDLAALTVATAWLALLMLAEPIGPPSWPFHLTWSSPHALVDKSILLMAMMAAASGGTFLSRVGWFLCSLAAAVAGYWIQVPLYYVVVEVALMRHAFTSTMASGSAAPFFSGWLTVGAATDLCRLLVAVMILRVAMRKLKAKEAVC